MRRDQESELQRGGDQALHSAAARARGEARAGSEKAGNTTGSSAGGGTGSNAVGSTAPPLPSGKAFALRARASSSSP
ncbi:hypothetical protein Y1Q_0022468 [Alligator mississippiensis]|uniref:Uncharacterized protein n=1 Tax=Alligator mississippiensis TaxID=8496 RepID=A0A151N0J8_ALLMI|nr:hypothetical protein Y1Q_0022468 [Alligator mississippiensis]